ncbi:MAG: hypothetical protein HZB99_00830 [Candidatus Harrisonbacteria bacterium]|nr:hypothetical protein [Candidatus Harrisonbacteria bacterium]
MRNSGQALIEILVALGVGVLMIGTASGALFIILRSGELSQKNRLASSLANGLSDNLTAFTESGWQGIYNLAEGGENRYYLATSANGIVVQTGEELINVNNINFSRYFYIENVSRDATGNIEASYNFANDDSSTQKATIVVSFPVGGATSTAYGVLYLTRWRNSSFQQTDWSGGSGYSGPYGEPNTKFFSSAFISASTSLLAAVPNQGELISSIFDTAIAVGARLNTVIWQGEKPAGTNVKFQIASSNSASGPWDYLGSDGSSSSFYVPAGPSVQIAVRQADHDNKRYLRYKIILEPDGAGILSPRVDDVILNWSP